ncbi:MAG: SRPBCC domain-containing protein [Gemmatimonadales bacterium]
MEQLESIRESVRIARPRERVWRYLVEPASVAQWLGCLEYAERVGQVFYMQPDDAKRGAGVIDGATHCEVLELGAPERFVFSWYLPGTPKTTVAITLRDDGDGGTLVELEHSGWDQFERPAVEAIHAMLTGGWRSQVLPGLRSLVERSETSGHPAA